MANVQIKGTRQEVLEMLQLFDDMNTKGFCQMENYIEVRAKHGDSFTASVHLQSGDWNDRFVSELLTGVYND